MRPPFDRQFTRQVCENADDLADAAYKLGITRVALLTRRAVMRREGYILRKFKSGPKVKAPACAEG